MLIYIALAYILYRVLHTLIFERGVDRANRPMKKIVALLLLEVVLVVIGIGGVMILLATPTPTSELGQHKTLHYGVLIFGVVCLIVSGRVGMYARKLTKGETAAKDEPPVAYQPSQDIHLGSLKNKTKIFLYIGITAWVFGAVFAYMYILSALLYTLAVAMFVVSFVYAKRLKANISVKKFAISFMVLSGFLAVFSVFSVISELTKIGM